MEYICSFFRLISIYFQMIKMECHVKKNEHFRHFLFAFNQGSKTAKAADFYSGEFYQRGIDNLVERLEVVNNNGECIID